jgi:hypothetical protein
MQEERNKAMKDQKQEHEGIMEEVKRKRDELQSELGISTRNFESCKANIKVSSNLCPPSSPSRFHRVFNTANAYPRAICLSQELKESRAELDREVRRLQAEGAQSTATKDYENFKREGRICKIQKEIKDLDDLLKVQKTGRRNTQDLVTQAAGKQKDKVLLEELERECVQKRREYESYLDQVRRMSEPD